MTENHWKSRLLMALLPFLFLSSTLLPCSIGQGNGNFFYYYSPTQRTQFNHGFGSAPSGQVFDNPFFAQQQQQPQQQVPTAAPQASFQQPSHMSFNHPQFQQGFYTPTAAPFQFPLAQPSPSPLAPEEHPQRSPAFTTFTRFENSAQLLGQSLPSQPTFLSTQSPLGAVSPGTFNFFQNPFQYLQQRFVQPTLTPTLSPALPTPTTTSVPFAPSPSPTPTSTEVEITPKPRFSSRFRYVQQPVQPQIRQYNPYTRLGSPYTSDLPYTEQRFYSSPTTPTGYAFSIGGDTTSGATSTVHFSMGPLSNSHQHLTEITNQRKMMHRQRISQSVPSAGFDFVLATPAPPSPPEFYDPPEANMTTTTTTTTAAPVTSTTTAPPTSTSTAPEMPSAPEEMSMHEVVAPTSMNATLEPLIRESSFQTETIADPADDVSRKISETNIPKRLVIRKKVARKRLQLNGSGEISEGMVTMMPNGVMIRRRINSPNRLPLDQAKSSEEESSKGFVESSQTEVKSSTTTTTISPSTSAPLDEVQPPQEVQHQPVSSYPEPLPPAPVIIGEETHMDEHDQREQPVMAIPQEEIPVQQYISTTPAPIQPPPVESLMAQPEHSPKQDAAEVYYDEDYEVEAPKHSISNQGAPRVMTAVKSPESESDLPFLRGVSKEDFPSVFHSSSIANSAETEQGQVISRVSFSQPSMEEQHQDEEVPPPPPSSTTTEAQQAFTKEDPADEKPPMETEEPAPPMFEPATPANMEEALPEVTPTPGPSSTEHSALESEEMNAEGEVQKMEVHDEQQSMAMPPPEAPLELSSTETQPTSPPALEVMVAQREDFSVVSSTESTAQDNEFAQAPRMELSSFGSSTEVEPGMSSTTEESTLMPEMEMSNPSSTESATNDEVSIASSTSTTTMNPLNPLEEQDPLQSVSQEVSGSQEGDEIGPDSEEIGRAQRLALEETLRRLRERQQTSSSTEPTEDDTEEDGTSGRKFMRRLLPDLANLPLPTSRSAPKINAVLDDEEGVDRNQVIEKIQKFRQNSRTTTTKRPRRVTRPSPASERRRVAVVAPVVEDLLEPEQHVDSFSDSSSTPGPVAEPATTTPTTTTVQPDESSSSSTTTFSSLTSDELTPEIDTVSSTERFTTTGRPSMLTSVTDEPSSTTTEVSLAEEEVPATTKSDIDPVTIRNLVEMTTAAPTTIGPHTTLPSGSLTSSTDASTYDDNDVVYEDTAFDNIQNAPVSSSTEVTTEVDVSSTTLSPLTTSTDTVYTHVTTTGTIDDSPFTTMTTTSTDSDATSSTTTTTPTAAGQLIIHEILPTMPPIKQVSFVIGESVEDDQSSGMSSSSSAGESDELLTADKAVVRVETNVHVVTNSTDIITSGEQISQEQLTPILGNSDDMGSGEGARPHRRVRVVIKKQRRVKGPAGGSGKSRRRRRKVLHRPHY